MQITVELEPYLGDSPVVRRVGATYRRLPSTAYRDLPARLTPRQAVFYRNLVRLAETLQSDQVPVDFELPNGDRVYLDHGCVKIAEHSGFIAPLRNGPGGVVETIQLAWQVEGTK